MRRLAMLLVAAFAIPAMASAQTGMSSDTTAGYHARGARTAHHARRRHMHSSGGEVGLDMGMDRSQVEQLQQALRSDGCDPGSVDGILGPRTRRAMACSRQKHSLTGRNTNELLRTLNLPFTTPDSMGMGSGRMMRGRGHMRDSTMMNPMADTTGRMHGNMRGMMRGHRDTTRPDTTH